MNVDSKDAEYVEIILDCLRVSATYKPKFGRGGRDGLTLRQSSTYDFMREVVGYDLGRFFERNAETLQAEVARVLQTLLDSGRP